MQNPSSLPPQLCFLNATTTATSSPKDPKTILYIIIAASLFSIVFFIYISNSSSSSFSSTTTSQSGLDPFLFPNRQTHRVLFPDTDPSSDPTPPSIAYLISGSAGDCGRIIRLLLAAYHPRNHYLLNLDLSAPQSERDALALIVRSLPIFKAAQNVNVIGKADFAYSKGSSTIPFTLHGASILLRLSPDWDWFVSLNAADYPLVTQDGSSFFILNRNFIEFCILGTDNLPRTLLMYFANTPSSLSNYFATVLCNSLQFKRAVINHNLLYATFDKHSNSEPHLLSSSDYEAMIKSGAAFATRFQVDDPVLNRIDQEILGRSAGKVLPGGWCLGESGNHKCSDWGDANVLRPGPGARRLEKRIVELLSNSTFQSHQCIVE